MEQQITGKRKRSPTPYLPSGGVPSPLQGVTLPYSPERLTRRKREPESEYLRYEGTPVEIGDVAEHFLSTCIGREELGLSPKVDLQRLYYEALTLGDFARVVGGVVIPVTDISEKHAMFLRDFGEPTEENVCTILSRSRVLRENPSLFNRNIFATVPSELQALIISQALMGSRPTRMAVPLVSRSWSEFSESRQSEIAGVYADLLPEILGVISEAAEEGLLPRMKFHPYRGRSGAGLVAFAYPAVPEGSNATPDMPYFIKRKPFIIGAPMAGWDVDETLSVPIGPDQPPLSVPKAGAYNREGAATLLDWWMRRYPRGYALISHWDPISMDTLAKSLPDKLLDFIFVEPSMSDSQESELHTYGWEAYYYEHEGKHLRIPSRREWVTGVNDRPEILRMAESWLSARLGGGTSRME